MSLKQNNFRRIIVQEEIKNPISFRYKRKNKNINNSDKNTNPINNKPFYIKTDLNQIENTNFLISNENNNIGIAHKHNFSYNIDFLNKNDSQKNIYVKKNMHISPQRCNSDRILNNNFFHPKSSNYHQIFSFSRNNIKNKNFNRIKIFNDKNNNENLININLIKGKNNFIENKKINHIYINKNKKNISIGGKYSLSNLSLNNKTEENSTNMNLTERNSIQRKNNFFCHYSYNYDYKNKNQITPPEKESNTKKTITKKRVNYLPRVIKSPIKEYNEFYIIKIQSVIRGYLLNKRLDRILRHYINFKEANEIMKRFYKRKIFKIIKAFKKVKRYQHQNIYYCKKRNYSQNKMTNIKIKENKNIQFKINELINEKNEQQINFKDLKDFMINYKQLINEKAEMLQEINKLRKTINKLQNIQEQKIINKNEKILYLIQKQKSLKFINTKNIIINNNENNKTKESKKILNVKDFLTLAKESKDNNDLIQNDKNKLRLNKLIYLFKNKENKTKIYLSKYFYRFYYLGLINNISKAENNKPKISVINRRYNVYNNYENINNFAPHISIKTLSDNSSVFNDGKGRNISILTGLNFTDEDNKRK